MYDNMLKISLKKHVKSIGFYFWKRFFKILVKMFPQCPSFLGK